MTDDLGGRRPGRPSRPRRVGRGTAIPRRYEPPGGTDGDGDGDGPGAPSEGTGWRRARALAGLALPVSMGVFLIVALAVSRQRQSALEERLERRRERLAEARRELAGEVSTRKALEERLKKRDEALDAARTEARESRRTCTRLEREALSPRRVIEEKDEELLRRHARIRELQADIERLMIERLKVSEKTHARELAIRREYATALGDERDRRREAERDLGAIDEINAMRDRLRRLLEELEKAHREETSGAEVP